MTKKQINNMTTSEARNLIMEHGTNQEKKMLSRFDTKDSDIRKVGREIAKNLKRRL